MKYKVMYTAGAKRGLRNIFRYIRKLDTMPNRNRLYEEEPWHSRGLRFEEMPYNNTELLDILMKRLKK